VQQGTSPPVRSIRRTSIRATAVSRPRTYWRGSPPSEDIVVVHGDATLTNLIIGANGDLGFVDCGHCGRGDRYIDLAVLAAEIEEHHGPEAAMRFIRAYGLDFWDARKARYFSDLYELF
jgi:aminoglycoside 3'-phosphotransferase-2